MQRPNFAANINTRGTALTSGLTAAQRRARIKAYQKQGMLGITINPAKKDYAALDKFIAGRLPDNLVDTYGVVNNKVFIEKVLHNPGNARLWGATINNPFLLQQTLGCGKNRLLFRNLVLRGSTRKPLRIEHLALFRNCVLQNPEFRHVTFRGTDIRNAEFTEGSFCDVDWRDSRLTKSAFRKCRIENSVWENYSQADAQYEDCQLINVALLMNTRLIGSHWNNCDLLGLTLNNATLDAVVKGGAWEHACIRKGQLSLKLTGTVLRGGTIFNSSAFHNSELADNRFAGVTMENCEFHSSSAVRSQIQGLCLKQLVVDNNSDLDFVRAFLNNQRALSAPAIKKLNF